MKRFINRTTRSNSKQRGVVLFIALIMLVAMSIAGIGLMRSVGGGVMLAGNLSMKAVTTRASDHGVEQVLDWILANAANSAVLEATTTAYLNGYSAVMNGPPGSFTPDLQGRFDGANQTAAWWALNGRTVPNPANLNDFTVQYVVHRMCTNTGAPDAECVRLPTPPGGCGQLLGCGAALGGFILYRATVRVTGPKGTESFVQVMVY